MRVDQRDWDHPELESWLTALRSKIEAAGESVVLVAHSLGCVLVAHAAARWPDLRVRGALLVAPADVDSSTCTPPETRCFSPLPLRPLPFPAIVVASRNDPFVTFERARALAAAWSAELVDAGEIGHINALSGLGEWPAGRGYLERLLAKA